MKFKDGWNNRILIVDDQENIHRDFDEMLKTDNTDSESDELAKAFGSVVEEPFLPKFEILHAQEGREAYKIIEETKKTGKPIAVIYMDIKMPGWDGIETIHRIREIDQDVEIVIMTAFTDKSLREINKDMKMLHKLLFIRKPAAREEIQQISISLVEKWNIEMESIENRRQLEINKKRLESVMNSTRDAIAMLNIKGDLLFANRYYGEMLGLLGKEFVNMPFDELNPLFQKCFMNPDISKKLISPILDETSEEIVELKWPDRKMLHQFIAPVYDPEKNVMGRILVYRDVSKELEIDQMKAEVLRLRTELEKEYSFHNIIGRSKKLQEVFTLMKQSAQSDITVLILGESGTGKELVAKSIHFNSPRKLKSFVAVNCAAIPETLIESELFGHEKGSFTGAFTQRIGKFEQANGGTILLDEIGEMHPLLQTRLLRVLQEREIQRIGGKTNIPVDVRVIASTNKNLEAAMKAGQFREDLYYRIAAFPIIIPPLRDHREDIPLLAEHFLNQFVKKSSKSISIISSECLKTLINYDWPGNVRELENAIERAVLLESSEVLQTSNLPQEILAYSKDRQIVVSKDDESETVEILSLDEVERQAILKALKITGNNIRQAAKLLKINRATIYRKMEKYNMAIKE